MTRGKVFASYILSLTNTAYNHSDKYKTIISNNACAGPSVNLKLVYLKSQAHLHTKYITKAFNYMALS